MEQQLFQDVLDSDSPVISASPDVLNLIDFRH